MAKAPDMEIPAPRENALLIGHAAAEAQFIEEFTRGTLHHAYLMTGPKGIGKATMAYRLARYVLGQGAQSAKREEASSLALFSDEPTHHAPRATHHESADSPIFRRIAAGSHTDLLTLSPAYDSKKHVEKSTIGVEEARKVPEFLSLTPAEGDWRVVIVDAVDQLNANAANALLKTIEEPPPRALILLICHAPGGILPTIRSRCRKLALTAPDATAFAEILHRVAPAIETHDYAALYALSYGSPGHAITLYQAGGLGLYEGWLAAMMPDGAPATRQKFADSAAAQKSPEAWAALIHGWEVAMQRLTLYPHYAATQPIFRREAEMLAAIAAATPPTLRAQWAAQGRALIAQTETFHLDKRYTVRMLTDPAQLMLAAA